MKETQLSLPKKFLEANDFFLESPKTAEVLQLRCSHRLYHSSFRKAFFWVFFIEIVDDEILLYQIKFYIRYPLCFCLFMSTKCH
jgi:hypothetical protein